MSSSKSPERLDEQPSEPKALDFNYAALSSETRIVVQQRRSEIKTLMRRAASDIVDIWQKLLKVAASQIRKNYVFGCSAASALNSRLPVSLVTIAKVHIQLGVWQLLPKWMVALKCSLCEHLDLAETFIFSLGENLGVAEVFIFFSYIHFVNIWTDRISHIVLIFSPSENLDLISGFIFSPSENLDYG